MSMFSPGSRYPRVWWCCFSVVL